MRENKDVRDLWRVVVVVSLFVAGLSFAFLAWWADALLPTVVLGFTSSLVLFLAAYESTTGGFLSRFEKGPENELEEAESADENSPSPQDILRKGPTVVREGSEKLKKMTASFLQYLRSFFTKVGPVKGGPSARQKEIWYEDILGQSVPQVKESLRKRNLDLEAVLKAEKRGRNREKLVQWLRKFMERDSNER